VQSFFVRAAGRLRPIAVICTLATAWTIIAVPAQSAELARQPDSNREATPALVPMLARADDQDAIVIDDSGAGNVAAAPEAAGEEIQVEDEASAPSMAAPPARPAPNSATAKPATDTDEIQIEAEAPGTAPAAPQPTVGTRPPPAALAPGQQWSISLPAARIEYGQLTKSSNPVNTSDYAKAIVRVRSPAWEKWELQLAARADAYLQTGTPDLQYADLDYGDSFVRYRGNNFRLTVGAETILWGRIDEVVPEDRISVVDLTRGILYDLPDRRRAAPVVRLETFFGGDNKLDLVWLPYFRGAELPNKDSIWYPVDPSSGNILGIETTPLIRTVVQGARIDDDAPSGQNGFGARFSSTAASLDYGLTVQWNRQSPPYFTYRPTTNTLDAEYPRSWVYGGDIGTQAAGAIWRAEAVYLTDVPVTTKLGQYKTVAGINWGAGLELHPGDGNARVNLQLVGRNLIDAPPVYDVYPYYNVNGTVDWPFLHDRWRAKLRFNVGLNVNDVYINPEIAFLGWEPNEFYLAGHYFSGSNGTIGGYWENDSMITIGWRGKF
jgi:hypothetical protein